MSALDLKAIRATIPHPDSLDGVRLGEYGTDLLALCDRVEALEAALESIARNAGDPNTQKFARAALEGEP